MSWETVLAKLASAVSKWDFSLIKLEKPTFNIVTGGSVGSISNDKAKKTRAPKAKKISPIIDVARLSLEQKKQLQSALQDALENDQTFILDEAPEVLADIKESISEPKNQELLLILQPYLSAADYSALRASIVLRYIRDRGDPMKRKQMKTDILNKFGDRGAKISNLCSAGYFDGVAAQLKKVKAGSSFNSDEFRKNLDEFIAQSAYALFVQDSWPRLQTRKAIVEKIRVNAVYGIKKIVIHALGQANIEKVQEVTEALLREFSEINKTHEGIASGEIRIRLEFESSIARNKKLK